MKGSTERRWRKVAAPAAMLVATSAGSLSPQPATAGHASSSIALSIMPHQLRALLDGGDSSAVRLIDLRPADSYARAHLPRARSMQPQQVEALRHEIPRDGLVVVYGSTTLDAVETFAVLQGLGYRNVRVLAGGFSGWTEAGFPVEGRP